MIPILLVLNIYENKDQVEISWKEITNKPSICCAKNFVFGTTNGRYCLWSPSFNNMNHYLWSNTKFACKFFHFTALVFYTVPISQRSNMLAKFRCIPCISRNVKVYNVTTDTLDRWNVIVHTWNCSAHTKNFLPHYKRMFCLLYTNHWDL